MFICATERGICLLEFTDRKMLETEFRDLQKLLNAQILIGENEHISQAKLELEAYFAGKRKEFEVSLDEQGTDFQILAWDALKSIAYGTTVSYQQQAERIQGLQSARTVAKANGDNRISIIVPCHRIIGKNGDLYGYGGGIERKKWLIDFEQSRK